MSLGIPLMNMRVILRICPGRYFAEDALFINISNALHVFDISPPLDERGAHIAVVPDVTDGLLSYVTGPVIFSLGSY